MGNENMQAVTSHGPERCVAIGEKYIKVYGGIEMKEEKQ